MLKIANLNKEQQKQKLFHDFNLILNQGEWLGISGENGSGKSTLAKIIMGLENYSEGKIFLGLKPKENFSKREWVQEVQLVSQYTRNALDPTKKIEKILLEPLNYFHSLSKWDSQKRIKQILTDCHLPLELLKKRPRELSGGQYQRICIALSLLVEPKVLICDEATANLDKINELRIIQRLKKEKQMAVLFISHDQKLVEQVCHRFVYLDR